MNIKEFKIDKDKVVAYVTVTDETLEAIKDDKCAQLIRETIQKLYEIELRRKLGLDDE